MNKFYNNLKTEKQRFPIMAGMQFCGNGNTKNNKIHKVGYRVVEFTYDINPEYPDDKMLISEREVKRVFTY